MAQMLGALGITLLGLLLFPGVALAHDLKFDSDLDENGIVQFANPQGIRPALFTVAIDDWNQKVLAGIQKGPIIADVTNNPGAFVEVIVDEQGGDGASFVARVVFPTHPDNIDLSARFADLPSEKRLGTVTHELGHTRGHAHIGAAYCSTSIMPHRGTCLNAGEVRRESVGSHDVSDTDALWYGPDATHPVRNKCWTNQDADGDGVCDRYGPPPAETAETDPGLPIEPPDASCSNTAVCNPTVSSVTPENGAKDVTVSANATATFSQAMDASTINTTMFTLTEQGDATPVAATVSYDPTTNKATLDPDDYLEAGATYTAKVSTGAKASAGNPLAAEKVWSFTTAAPAETTPPSAALTAPAEGEIVSGASVTLSADATDNVGVDRVEFLVNGNRVGTDAAAPYSVGWDSTAFPDEDGRVTIAARAFDSAGNSKTSAAREVIVNNTLPETTITTGPSAIGKETTATFQFTSSERDSTFRCKLDDEPAFTECASPKTYAGLADGEHTFQVKAVGAGGEANDSDGTPASRAWTVDTAAPAPPDITSPVNDSLNNTGNVAVSGTAEAGSTVEIFDGTTPEGTVPANASGDWSKTLTGVAEGSHTYTAKATDAAGNTSAVSNARRVIVDTTPPDTTIDSSPSGAVNSTSATFEFSSTEASSTFECKLDDGIFAACASPKSYADLADGSHVFQVRATDTAGNTDLTPASRAWTVDTTAPTVGSVSPVDGATDVAVDTNVEATFSEAMEASTVNGATFELTEQDSTTPVSATITYDSTTKTATLDPDADLKAATTYTVTIKGGANGVMDTAGNALTSDKVWSFTTAAPADTTP